MKVDVRSMGLQCPACGEPTNATEFRVVQPATGVRAIEFTPCGHAITPDALRDVWGWDIPDV